MAIYIIRHFGRDHSTSDARVAVSVRRKVLILGAGSCQVGDHRTDLDDVGTSGWELVAVVQDPENKRSLLAFFKRPIDLDAEMEDVTEEITFDDTKEH